MPIFKKPADPNNASKLRKSLNKFESKATKAFDKVGVKVNNLSHKIGTEGFWPGPMPGEIDKAARILRTFTTEQVLETATASERRRSQKVLVKIPPKLIQNAQGLAIFTVFRSGLGLSGGGGSGLVISRRADGSWGSPSGILIHTIGFGWLAGIDVYDVVLILRTRAAVDAFARAKVSLGAEMTVTAGPVGAGAMVDTGIEASPVLSYVKSKGLYGGLQIDGNIILERNDENARFYNRSKIKASEILSPTSTLYRPIDCEPLILALAAAEGQTLRPEQVSKLPPSVSPAQQMQDVVDQNGGVVPVSSQEQLRWEGDAGRPGLSSQPGSSSSQQEVSFSRGSAVNDSPRSSTPIQYQPPAGPPPVIQLQRTAGASAGVEAQRQPQPQTQARKSEEYAPPPYGPPPSVAVPPEKSK